MQKKLPPPKPKKNPPIKQTYVEYYLQNHYDTRYHRNKNKLIYPDQLPRLQSPNGGVRFWRYQGQVFACTDGERVQSQYLAHDTPVDIQRLYRVGSRFSNIEESTIDLGTVQDNILYFAAKADDDYSLHDINATEFNVLSITSQIDFRAAIASHLVQLPTIHNPGHLDHPDNGDGIIDAADYIMWRNRPNP